MSTNALPLLPLASRQPATTPSASVAVSPGPEADLSFGDELFGATRSFDRDRPNERTTDTAIRSRDGRSTDDAKPADESSPAEQANNDESRADATDDDHTSASDVSSDDAERKADTGDQGAGDQGNAESKEDEPVDASAEGVSTALLDNATGAKVTVAGPTTAAQPETGSTPAGPATPTASSATSVFGANPGAQSETDEGDGKASDQKSAPQNTASLGGQSATEGASFRPSAATTEASLPGGATGGVNAASTSASSTGVDARVSPSNLSAITQPSEGAADNDAINQARLTRGLRSALNQQGGSVTLRLTPPEMGTVRIQLDLAGPSVSARFHAESDAARAMLQQQLGQLRGALEGQGLSVDRLSVQPMNDSSASNFTRNEQQGQPDSDGRSRGQYQSSQQRGGRDQSDSPQGSFNEFLTDTTDDDHAAER